VDIDHGKVFGRHVKDEAVVVGLNELAPIGRWAAGRRDVRRLGEPVPETKRRELDDAIGPRPRGLASAVGSHATGPTSRADRSPGIRHDLRGFMSRRDSQITLAQIRDAAEKARTLCAAHTLDSLFLG